MTRGGYRLPKVSFGPAMPYLSTIFGLADAETASWGACGRLLPLWTTMPYAYVFI
jgi:hypothetical protein